jgi:hypothetical protein
VDRSKLILFAFALTKLEEMANWQIQAAVFLLQQRLPVSYPYSIELDTLGPYSEDLQKDLHALVSQSELDMISTELYRARNDLNAQDLKAQAVSGLSQAQIEEVTRMMSWVTRQQYGSLVTKLYRNYPDYRNYKKPKNER